MLRIALFLALVAGASATSDYPGTATCALLTKYSKCQMITWVAAGSDTSPSTYCSCNPIVTGQCTDTTQIPAKSVGCALDNNGDCELADKTGIESNVQQWMSDDQKKCLSDGTDETKCNAIAGCVYSKPAGVAGGYCLPTTDSLVATATGKGATAVGLAALKLELHKDSVCGPISKDEATCNANLQCAYNTKDKTCKTSIFYLVHILDSGGCTDEAADVAKLYGVDVAQANAIVSGAAGFSTFAVVVSALVSALSLIA